MSASIFICNSFETALRAHATWESTRTFLLVAGEEIKRLIPRFDSQCEISAASGYARARFASHADAARTGARLEQRRLTAIGFHRYVRNSAAYPQRKLHVSARARARESTASVHVHAKSVYSAGAYTAAEDMQIRIYFQREHTQRVSAGQRSALHAPTTVPVRDEPIIRSDDRFRASEIRSVSSYRESVFVRLLRVAPVCRADKSEGAFGESRKTPLSHEATINIYSASRRECAGQLFINRANERAHSKEPRRTMSEKEETRKRERERQTGKREERANERVVRDELSREKGWCGDSSKRDEELPW